MKNNNSQLDDLMILSLADAHESCVNFSDAMKIANIPDSLMSEAKVYWNFLKKQSDLITNILPEETIVDSALSKMNYAPLLHNKAKTPSPYMKFVMAFAAPVSIIVMIFGIVYRQDRDVTPELPVINENISGITASPNTFNLETTSNETPAAKVAAKTITTANDATASYARVMTASPSAISKEEIQNSDPRQLFAMLTNTGSFEAEPDTRIDEVFDAKLSELDSIVVDNNTTK